MDSLSAFFPTPFPNEDFRSIFYRYHQSSFNSEIIDTNMELVGIRNNFSFFPKALTNLITKLPKTTNITVDSLIYNNTILPTILPFIPEHHHSKILEELYNGGALEDSSVGKLVGNKYGKNMSDLIRYCPSCIEEDTESYGCSYIHREHQYAFIHTCSKHSNKLITHCKECGVSLEYSPLIEHCKNGHHNYYDRQREPRISDDIQKSILKDLDYILNNSRKISRWLVEQRFLEQLNSKGYISKTGNSIMTKKLVKDFMNYYSSEVVTDFGLDINYLAKHNTLDNLFRGSKLVINLPLILLYIQFLSGSVESFIRDSKPYLCEIPFGKGPWCCENKYCPKYKQDVIHQCERTYMSGEIKGNFICSFCDTSYVINWNQRGDQKQAKHRKLKHLDSKQEKILTLWESGLPIADIVDKLYCSHYFVKNVVKQKYKGCNINQVNPNKEVAVFVLNEKMQIIKEKHRNKLLNVLDNGKELSRSEIKNNCKASYTWLQQHDKQWLEENLPPSKSTGKFNRIENFQLNREKYRSILLKVIRGNRELMRSEIKKKCKTAYIWLKKNDQEWLEKQLPPSKSIIKFDWNEVDQVLAQRVKKVSAELIESNPNKRVARYTIMGALTTKERGRIKSYIQHLPLTDQALTESAETKEQYQIRHLPAIVQQLRTYYNYEEVTLDIVMSYRRSYRQITDRMKEILIAKLKTLN
ncbi:TnsD family Tn7-like transposition protein [Fredinandcohnia salidurans]|uniref:TnsD family Tn7-like transposition protein n=1 Tax=Fredinandcohnia salidurans TaxID=2595041 RepID=A0ABW4MTF7_9BACI